MNRILIADDDTNCRAVVGDALSDTYEVVRAVNGRELIEQAVTVLPDAILLDIMMSGQDGLMALKELKSMPETRHVPVIMLTALDSSDLAAECLNTGAFAYVTKPFSNDDLRARVQAALEQPNSGSRSEDQLTTI